MLQFLPLEDRLTPSSATDPALANSLRTLIVDLNNDGVNDLVATRVVNGTSTVRVVDGTNSNTLYEIEPFAGYRGALNLAVGDVDGDGRRDLAIGQAADSSRVKIISGADQRVLFDRVVYDASFRGGVAVALGDVTGDGRADLITGAGFRGGPHVRVYSGANFTVIRDFFAYDSSFRGGVNVAAGDVNGDGAAEIVTGAGLGGSAHVRVFNGRDFRPINGFFAGDSLGRGGVQVAVGDADGDGHGDIGTLAGQRVRIYDNRNPTPFVDRFPIDRPTYFPIMPVGRPDLLTLGDIDGDGSADAVFSDSNKVWALRSVVDFINERLERLEREGEDLRNEQFQQTFDWNHETTGRFMSQEHPSQFTFDGKTISVNPSADPLRAYSFYRNFTGPASAYGLFAVDDGQGRINGILPGQAGYLDAVRARRLQLQETPTVGASHTTGSPVVPGQHYGFYFERDGVLTTSFESAVRFVGNDRIALESDGDGDNNDMIVRLTIEIPATDVVF